MLLARLEGDLSRAGIRFLSGEDLLQQALAGINTNGSRGKHRFHAVGVLARENILSGVETPSRLAGGTLGTWVHRMALNVIKKKGGAEISTSGLGERPMSNRPEAAAPTQDSAQILIDCMVGSSEIALKLRHLLAGVVDRRFPDRNTTRVARQIMHTWLGALGEGKLLLPGMGWAIAAGLIDPSEGLKAHRHRNNGVVQVSKTWRKIKPLFRQALAHDAGVRSLIDLRLSYADDLHAVGKSLPVPSANWSWSPESP
jgi:hypothetical protein